MSQDSGVDDFACSLVGLCVRKQNVQRSRARARLKYKNKQPPVSGCRVCGARAWSNS